MLKKALENILSEKEQEDLFSAFDQIGDIIIVRIPDSLVSKKKIIGEVLLEQVKTAMQGCVFHHNLECNKEKILKLQLMIFLVKMMFQVPSV